MAEIAHRTHDYPIVGLALHDGEAAVREQLAGEAEPRVKRVERELAAKLDAARAEAQRTRVELCADRGRAERADGRVAEGQRQLESLRVLLADSEMELQETQLRVSVLARSVADARVSRVLYRAWMELPRDHGQVLVAVGLSGVESRVARLAAAPKGTMVIDRIPAAAEVITRAGRSRDGRRLQGESRRRRRRQWPWSESRLASID